MRQPARITILTGHFGSGKTEIAINLALKERKNNPKVAISDLDVINPYFRSRDASNLFLQQGIELIAPRAELASSDLPIVSGEIYRVLHDSSYRLIIDAGGDKDGATVLGQYYNEWKDSLPDMLFVLNANRPYVSTLEGALSTIEQIESASRLKVNGIINNSNLGSSTTMEDVLKGLQLSTQVAERLAIPLVFTGISTHLEQQASDFLKNHPSILIQRFMKLPWEG